MKVMAIETATHRQSVAIVDDTQVVASAASEEADRVSRWLVPTIDRLLELARCTVVELDGLIVSHGPGSFTGLRVGLATALGFRAVTGRPLVMVGTLEAMLWGVRGMSGPICPVLFSRKDEVYWAQYEWSEDGTLKTLVEPQVGHPELVARSVRRPTLVLGEGWLRSQEVIVPNVSIRAREWKDVPAGQMHPSAITVAHAGWERLLRGQVAGEVVVPHYVQRAEAELKYGLVEGKSVKILRGAGRAPRRRRVNG